MTQQLLFNWTGDSRREARRTVKENQNERIVLEVMKRFPNGATPQEVAQTLGWNVTSVRPRMTILAKPERRKLLAIGRRKVPGSRVPCTVYILPEYYKGDMCRA